MVKRRSSRSSYGTLFWTGILLMFLVYSRGIHAVDNVITEWNAITQKVVRTLGLPTQIGARTHALVHISQYKAIQLASEQGNLCLEAAAAYAAHYVLSEIFPAQQSPVFDEVIAEQIHPLNLSKKEDAEVQNIAFISALKELQQRVLDGSQRWAKFEPAPAGSPPGEYQFTPNWTWIAFPQLGTTRPFVIRSPKEFDLFGGPYQIPSPGYDAEYDVLSTVGNTNSPEQTSYQRDTGKFWEFAGSESMRAVPGVSTIKTYACEEELAKRNMAFLLGFDNLLSHTSGVVGEFFNISIEIVQPDLTLKETARLFAILAAASYDAPIAAWYQKHNYLFYHNSFQVLFSKQGDPSHPPNFDFEPVLVAPPEPEYPSGHASNAGAWAAVFSKFLGQKDPSEKVTPFVVATESYFLPNRTYDSIFDPAYEVAMSRVYGGIHFPKAVNDGFNLGRKVGEYVVEHFEEIYGVL